MSTTVDLDIGILLSIRHGKEQSPLFEFQFELDIDAMEEAGFGHSTYFCFVYDAARGKVIEITSGTEPEVLAAAMVHPDYEGNMGTEYVLKYEGKPGSGDVVYSLLSFEPDEIDDPDFSACFDEITSVFFEICTQALAQTKASLL